MVQENRHVQAGFSIIELVIYTGIVMMIVVGSVVTIRQLRYGAKVSATEQMLEIVKSKIDGYNAREDEYPADLNALKPRYLSAIPKDGWGNLPKYKVTESGKHPYELYSYGEDGPGGDVSKRIYASQK